ncbi:non-ribosomal peptide synthetase [Nonomuraea angiospora]|uniref:non-ribosomal peptide synthetase n=1 Tax=Nonomuraea angiospora TaxID=46172 RepID=UPI0033FD5384
MKDAADPAPRTLHERITAVARSQPDRIAIEDARHRLTYAEVLEWADQMAVRLLAAGARPDTVVGVHLDRSAEAVVAMLGVLKAGAAYLSLPVDFPADRLRFMARDARVRLVVTEDGLAEGLEDLTPVPVRRDPDDPADPSGFPRVHRSGAAYVIYTSGSTGTPKGVVVAHENVANLVDGGRTHLFLSHDDGFLQLSPLHFDPSALEIWGALANGARLVIAAPSYGAIDELPDVTAKKEITAMVLSAPLFHLLMDKRPAALDGVRELYVGGDVLSAARGRAFMERGAAVGDEREVFNAYGPTEATVMVSRHSLRDLPADAAEVPLGRPISGARMYLLDEDLRQVGPHERGEIYIGGAGVARGYLGRPGLTAQRFLPDPYAGRPGARMYATGDHGVLGDDGLIEFVGRLDDQVKVRGHRVELGEVERVLRDHPEVEDACVVLAGSGGPNERLVAHVSPARRGADPTGALPAHVAALPAYMRPSSYVVHDRLPMTAVGKIDRRRLSQIPDGPRRDDQPLPGDAPADVERALTAIWARNLDVEAVDPDASFFSLGGTSMLAMSIVAEAQDQGLPMTLTTLFKNPTLRLASLAITSSRGLSSGATTSTE